LAPECVGDGFWDPRSSGRSARVERDVIEGKVSPAAARDDYGVVLKAGAGDNAFAVDAQETISLRAKLKSARTSKLSMIDRGEGFEKMIRGEVKPWTRSA